MKPTPPSAKVQQRAVQHVQDYFEYYSNLLTNYRRIWLELFRAIYIFEPNRKGKGRSEVFWPLCFRETQKVSDRLTSNNPKFVISLNVPINPDDPEADMKQSAIANQAAINYWWKLGNSQAKLRAWGRQGLDYGVSFAQVDFDRKIHKTKEKQLIEKDGILKEKTVETETVLAEYPVMDVPDIFDVYFDPRLPYVDDYHSMVVNKDEVRKAELMQQKDIFFNMDKIEELQGSAFSYQGDNYKMNKFNQEGIPTYESYPNQALCNVKDYYGYFAEEEGGDEDVMYRMTVLNGTTLIRYEEIDFIPFEKFVPLEVPGQGVGKGVAEPVKKLQDAYNLVRNQRLENVSLIQNRMWLMKTTAGIDVRKLVSMPGNVIPVRDMDGLRPIDTPDLSQSSFAEANAINTEIQSINSTIDTTQDSSDSGFTNLATGQRIRWSEFNSRFAAIKRNLEESLARLGEKMLMSVAERATQNPLIEDEETKKFYEIAKTAFNSFADFYTMSVLSNSTAYDSLENKRDDALAKAQLGIAWKAQGVNVDMNELAREVLETFPGTDVSKIILPAQPQPQEASSGGIPQSTIDQAKTQGTPEQQLTEQLTYK